MDLVKYTDDPVFKTLNEASPFGIFVTDKEGQIIYVNRRFDAVTGYGLRDVEKSGWVPLIHELDRDQVVKDYFEAIAAERPYQGRFRVIKPTGELIWLKSDVTEIREQTDLIGYLGTLEDITGQVRMKNNLEESYKAYHQLMEGTTAAIFSVDLQFRYTAFNSAYEALAKSYGRTDVKVGNNHLDGLAPLLEEGAHEKVKRNFAAAFSGKVYQGIDEVMLPGDRKCYYDVTISPVKGASDEIIGAISFFQDVTERILLQRERDEQSQVLRAMLENIPLVVYKVSAEGVITRCEGSGLDMVGLTHEDMVGLDVFAQWPALAGDVRKAMDGEVVQFIQTMPGPEHEFYFRHHLFADISVPGGVIGLGFDITAEKLSESRMLDAKAKAEEAATAKQLFLSNMSHEIRTPINAIIGMTYLLMQETPLPHQLENLKTLRFSAENLLALVNDVLDYSKIEAGKIIIESLDFNLHELVNNIGQAQQTIAREKGLALHIIQDPRIPSLVSGDPVRLTQVLNNLMSNAIKFTDEGSITVEVKLNSFSDKQVLLDFRVTDTGIGIASNQHQAVFESFMQVFNGSARRYGGTGLGLPITRRLLQLQGSDIVLESEPGKGSTFSFKLGFGHSRLAQTVPAAAYSAPMEFETFSGNSVLLVDDNETNLIVATKFMKKWGLEVDQALSGREACDKVFGQAYDIVLMDLQMPGMSGYEASRLIRSRPEAQYRQIPIIALTADVMPEVKDKALEAGMNDYVSKPFNPRELYSKVAKYLRVT